MRMGLPLGQFLARERFEAASCKWARVVTRSTRAIVTTAIIATTAAVVSRIRNVRRLLVLDLLNFTRFVAALVAGFVTGIVRVRGGVLKRLLRCTGWRFTRQPFRRLHRFVFCPRLRLTGRNSLAKLRQGFAGQNRGQMSFGYAGIDGLIFGNSRRCVFRGRQFAPKTRTASGTAGAPASASPSASSPAIISPMARSAAPGARTEIAATAARLKTRTIIRRGRRSRRAGRRSSTSGKVFTRQRIAERRRARRRRGGLRGRRLGFGRVAGFQRRRSGRRGDGLRGALFRLVSFILRRGDMVEFFDVFEKIADVQEGVAIEADIDEGRLHAREHARDPAFVDAAD